MTHSLQSWEREVSTEPSTLHYEFRFPLGNGPADNLAAVNVNDGVQEVEDSLLRPWEFRDVSRPAFIWSAGLQHRHGVLPSTLVSTTAPVTSQAVIEQ